MIAAISRRKCRRSTPAFVIAVAEGTPDEQLQINENALIPYITKALQEMDARITALENAMQEKGGLMNTQTLDLDLSKDGLGGNLVRVGQGR